jgi:tetraacyldisaccharide 4'-kinase
MKLRRWAYASGLIKQFKVACPVVSVGNLTLGGNGKTPMTQFLAKVFLQKGYRPAILSRGYGRRPSLEREEPLVVSLGQGPLLSAQECGDEPFLSALKSQATVVLARRRSLAALKAIELGANILILDDGFQHLSLAREVDLLMLQADQDLKKERIIPAGYLREPGQAQEKADVLVALGREKPAALQKMAGDRPLHLARLAPICFRSLDFSSTAPLDKPKGGRLAAFCGLAKPEAFFRTLADLSLEVRSSLSFPDHARYDPDEIAALHRLAKTSQADYLLTTLKDAVKLPLALNLPILALDVELELDRPDDFVDQLFSRLSPTKPEASRLDQTRSVHD